MKHTAEVLWQGNMMFDALVGDHHFTIDAAEESGGGNNGPRPKELMLVALAGCTGMDVVSILKKMRVELSYFNVKVEAPITEDHPKHYTRMHIVYEFGGHNLETEKLQKAIDLSQERYCGVSFMYKKAFEISSEIRIVE
jgi:putative redox protein